MLDMESMMSKRHPWSNYIKFGKLDPEQPLSDIVDWNANNL